MSTPIVIHMQRPYASEEEYLAQERFSIEAKSMLLIDQPALPFDTAVVFDVALESGQKLIRAEARVIGYVAPEGDRPGGLRVRFRRFGAATKAFIDRAVSGVPAAPAVVAPVVTTPAAPAIDIVATQPTPISSVTDSLVPMQTNETKESEEASGIHPKAITPVVAPANREALLARLRGRRVG